MARDKCFWGPLLPGGGKLPSQIFSEFFFIYFFFFWGNKADFRLRQCSVPWELELFARVPEWEQKGQKAAGKDFIASGKKPKLVLIDPDYLHSENVCNEQLY